MSSPYPPPGSPPEGFPPSASAPATPPPDGGGRNVLIGVVAGVLVFAVAAATFAGWRLIADNVGGAAEAGDLASAEPTPGGGGAAPRAALQKYYDQTLDWRECGSNECATLTVPLDYAKPRGATLEIAVLKVSARRSSERIGSLVVNPGGPGGSGVEFASYGSLVFGGALSAVYDIVGFDPRGVGRSEPLTCLDTEGMDDLLGFDPDPDTAAEVREMDQLIAGLGEACVRESGALAEHMSTVEAVKDMDVLRAALGESKLDYFGFSYGTLLGATYADLFPDKVGRFVLDGAIDPSLSNEKLSLEQAGGFETALRAYLADCVAQGGCLLGDSVEAGLSRIQGLLAEVDANPLPTGDAERPLTEGWAMLGIWYPLYVKSLWPQLTDALREAIVEGRGTDLQTLADGYTSRGDDGYTDNSTEALYAVNCLDHSDSIPSSEVPSRIPEFERVSPTFGRAFAYSLSTCANWPIQSGERTKALHAEGAAPIVVIGTTRDPATPLRWAQAMARQLESGTLITRDGDGHTGFQQGNDCVDDAVEDFLIRGTEPRANLMC